jgi:hypothetical protein
MNIPMTEPRNPLEVVEEALAALEYGERWTEGTTTRKRCPLCASGYPEHQPDCVVPAALALVRKMRADAVVGWVSPVIDDSWFEDFLVRPFRAFAWEAEPDNPRYTRALLLLPLPDSTEDDES